MVSSRSVMVSGHIFEPLAHLELLFVYDGRWYNFILLLVTWMLLLFQTVCVWVYCQVEVSVAHRDSAHPSTHWNLSVLVAQGIRMHLPRQWMLVSPLSWKGSTCHWATEPTLWRPHAAGTDGHAPGACAPQKPPQGEAQTLQQRAAPAHCNQRRAHSSNQDPAQSSSLQSLTHVQLFVTPWTTVQQASLSITSSWSPPKPMSIKSVMPSNHLIHCHPLLLLPSIFSSIRVFSNESNFRIRWPKYWSFSFIISPSNEHSGLISFRMDWLDLLGVQGTLKTLLQHHSSKASILQHSAFFIVQLSHPYHDYWKNHSYVYMDLCWQSNVSAFNMLSRLVIAFLPRSKHLLISWLQSQSYFFGAQRNKVSYCFCFSNYLPWSDGTRCHDLSFLNVEL